MSSSELSKVESSEIIKLNNLFPADFSPVAEMVDTGLVLPSDNVVKYRLSSTSVTISISWSGAIWNTFGPIAQTVEEEFGWTDKTLTMFTWWAVLDFPLFFLPSSFILSRSLRYSVLAASSCSVIGATIR